MMRLLKYLCLFTMGMAFFTSCHKSGEKGDITRLVSEWMDKEVLFPDNMVFTIQGKDTVDFAYRDADYKIVSYVDSAGCLSCKLQLENWKKVIQRIDSVAEESVPFVFVFNAKTLRDIILVTRKEGFTHPIVADMGDKFNRMNHFPTNINFQSMLVDKNNKVLAIGNPVLNPKVLDLYQSIILGQGEDQGHITTLTDAELETERVDFGTLAIGNPQQRMVWLKNTGSKPLMVQDVVVSCGCTKVDYPEKPIMPNETGYLTISYDADKVGNFHKTITLYCNAVNSPLQIELKGNVI